MKILHVVGARPNFMKAAPVIREMAKYPDLFHQRLVHTGQHYDYLMSKVFFEDLGLPEPDYFLQAGSGSNTRQVAAVMAAMEPVLQEWRPDWVIVVGDVNSTLASALASANLKIPVAHVEAGLRSGDCTMPEEINRILTDRISSLHFTPSEEAGGNLRREGIAPENIHFVGNVMIDSLIRVLPKAEPSTGAYALCTFHRPVNVDNPAVLHDIMQALNAIAARLPVIFPVHPRTRKMLQGISSKIQLIDPLGYLDFVALLRSARLVITDSGGIQEETTFLGVPCLTVRPNTERPVTITHGTNRLVTVDRIEAEVDRVLTEERTTSTPPPLWDGNTAARIVDVFRHL